MARQRRPHQTFTRQESTAEMTDDEVQVIMTHAMADAGATPAAVFAFHKAGICLTLDNEHRWSPEQLSAWNDAVNEYNSLASLPTIRI